MRVWILLSLFASALAKHEAYIGWKSYYVSPSNHDELKTFGTVARQLDIDILSHPYLDREGVVLVEPHKQDVFISALDSYGISHRIHADNIKEKLDYDDQLIEEQKLASITRNGGVQMPYDNYQEWEVIDGYVADIARRFPNIATLVHAADSFEGRPIRYLKISTTNFEDRRKPVIVIDAGIHAREWITPPTVTWAIHKLTENVTEPDLLEQFDWILLPVANPDGYKFTFNDRRFWRMTRSTDQHILSQQCPGVDGNRNYDFFWNTVGTSNTPCWGDSFAGSRPFSEIETRVIRDILLEHLPRISLYLTMHSFGSMILYSWGHDGSLPNNALGLHVVGVAMAEKIDQHSLPHFPRYVVGNSVLVLGYGASGASEDYAHSIGVPLAYTYELPGLSRSFDGFHLPPRYILQVSQETWEGIAVGARISRDWFVPPLTNKV